MLQHKPQAGREPLPNPEAKTSSIEQDTAQLLRLLQEPGVRGRVPRLGL